MASRRISQLPMFDPCAFFGADDHEQAFQNIIFLDDCDLLGAPTIQLRYQSDAGSILITSRRGNTTWVTNAEMHLEFGKGERSDVDTKSLRNRYEMPPFVFPLSSPVLQPISLVP